MGNTTPKRGYGTKTLLVPAQQHPPGGPSHPSQLPITCPHQSSPSNRGQHPGYESNIPHRRRRPSSHKPRSAVIFIFIIRCHIKEHHPAVFRNFFFFFFFSFSVSFPGLAGIRVNPRLRQTLFVILIVEIGGEGSSESSPWFVMSSIARSCRLVV